MAGTGAPGAEHLLLCLAPLEPAGGVGTVLTAFGLLAGDRPALHLHVVGGGPMARTLAERAADLGLDDRVHLPGHLPWPRLLAALHRCAALVLPHPTTLVLPHPTAPAGPRSTARLLPRSPGPDPVAFAATVHRAVREALAAGRPVVGTGAAAPPELLRAGVARPVPPGDPAALALALADVLGPVPADPQKRW